MRPSLLQEAERKFSKRSKQQHRTGDTGRANLSVVGQHTCVICFRIHELYDITDTKHSIWALYPHRVSHVCRTRHWWGHSRWSMMDDRSYAKHISHTHRHKRGVAI